MGKVAKDTKVGNAKAAKLAFAKEARADAADAAGATADAPFDPLTFLTQAAAGKTIAAYRTGETVFAQGDIADTVYYVQTGKLKVVVLSAQGKEAVVGILRARQFFGEGCLNGHSLRVATTTAIEDCVVTAITKKAMTAVLHDQPKFSQLFMSHLLNRNGRIEEDLIDQLFNSSEQRLARLLLLLADFGRESIPQPIDAKITQETLAEMIGTTRSRVNYFMNKFRKRGFISYNRTIEVNNSLLNAVICDKPQLKAQDSPDW